MSKKVGRPKSDVETEVIAVRIPVELGERLDRYLDRLEAQHGIKSNRNSAVRHALRLLLDAEEKKEENTLRKGPDVPIPSIQTSVEPRKKPQVLSPIRKQILALVQQYPQGISPIETRRLLAIEKDLGNTMKSMERDGLLKRIGVGCYVVGEKED